MHETYQKIHGLFKRDEKGRFIEGEWSLPAFAALRFTNWRWLEKIDGTNIRVGWDPETKKIEVRGKTDRADLPADLVSHIQELFPVELFERLGHSHDITVYGEGYGGKIQGGSATYGPDKKFIAFDLRVGDYWFNHAELLANLGEFNIPVAQTLLVGDIYDAIYQVEEMVVDHGQGPVTPEGVVGRPQLGDLFHAPAPGARVLTKVKVKDIVAMKESSATTNKLLVPSPVQPVTHNND